MQKALRPVEKPAKSFTKPRCLRCIPTVAAPMTSLVGCLRVPHWACRPCTATAAVPRPNHQNCAAPGEGAEVHSVYHEISLSGPPEISSLMLILDEAGAAVEAPADFAWGRVRHTKTSDFEVSRVDPIIGTLAVVYRSGADSDSAAAARMSRSTTQVPETPMQRHFRIWLIV